MAGHAIAISQSANPVVAVVLGGGIAATLDIVYACLSNAQYSKTPLWVFQSVASGWIGSAAFSSGVYGGAIGPSFSHSFFAPPTPYCPPPPLARSCRRVRGLVWRSRLSVHEDHGASALFVSVQDCPYTPLRLIEGFASACAYFVGIPDYPCVGGDGAKNGENAVGP